MDALVTPRLRLRPLRRADLRTLHAMYGDPEMMEHITGYARTPRQTAARLRKDLRHHREHGFGLCLGLLRQTGEVVGRYGLEPCPGPGGLAGELAWMTRAPFRGRGLAVEAAEALIAFGLGTLGLDRVFASVAPANAASLEVARRLGMEPAGTRAGFLIFEVRSLPGGLEPA